MVFTIGLPVILKLSPKTSKNIFWRVSFKINFSNFDLWFFPNEKYGSRGLTKNTKTIVIELLRFLIEKLLFLLSKIPGTLYSPISGSEIYELYMFGNVKSLSCSRGVQEGGFPAFVAALTLATRESGSEA